LIIEIRKYLETQNPFVYLFNGKYFSATDYKINRFSQKAMCVAISHAGKKAHIVKTFSAHSLRHTYATHLLEDGLDIVSIKNLLGHSHIETTLVYLHVAQCDKIRSFSPLDTLYGLQKSNFRRSEFHCEIAGACKNFVM
jgi:site-specific recombinase XerD